MLHFTVNPFKSIPSSAAVPSAVRSGGSGAGLGRGRPLPNPPPASAPDAHPYFFRKFLASHGSVCWERISKIQTSPSQNRNKTKRAYAKKTSSAVKNLAAQVRRNPLLMTA